MKGGGCCDRTKRGKDDLVLGREEGHEKCYPKYWIFKLGQYVTGARTWKTVRCTGTQIQWDIKNNVAQYGNMLLGVRTWDFLWSKCVLQLSQLTWKCYPI